MNILDNETKLRRYCFLGSFDSVYVFYGKTPINISKVYPLLKELLATIEVDKLVGILTEVLNNSQSHRRDEPLFLYAAYLTSIDSDKCRLIARQAFPKLIENEEDLFLFCKYAFLIKNFEEKHSISKPIRKAITLWYEVQTAESLSKMAHRGYNAHGFNHKFLLKLCHINNKQMSNVSNVKLFFEAKNKQIEMQSTTIDDKGNNHEITSMQAVQKLRRTENKKEAMRIIRKHKLGLNQVPGHLLRHKLIMKAVMPFMTQLEIIKKWGKLGYIYFFEYEENFKLLKNIMKNKNMLKKENIHPLVFLLEMSKMPQLEWSIEKKMQYKIGYFKELFLESFGKNIPTGLKMLITINLQQNYSKKFLSNYKNVNCLEACVALAFGYFKIEKVCDVYYWKSDNQFGQVPWTKKMSYEDALNCCKGLVMDKCHQHLCQPILEALKNGNMYDLFLSIVPTAGFNNKANKSESLWGGLVAYRINRKSNNPIKYVIVDLRKFRKSMYYSNENVEDILEICGLDENTPNLINRFAFNSFT